MQLFRRFFQKKPRLLAPVDMQVLFADVHSHLIPGIDDGAQNMQQSIELISELKAMGYQKIITTPHIMYDYYKNSSKIILDGLKTLKSELKKQSIDIEVEAASEYYLDEHFMSLLEKDDILTFSENMVLFELSFINEPKLLHKAIFEMQVKGYRPVLAHVERYPYWHVNYDHFHALKDKGVLFQLNTNSLTEHYGPGVKKAAEYMVEQKMYDFVGSDCHHLNHVELTNYVRKLPLFQELVQQPQILNKTL